MTSEVSDHARARPPAWSSISSRLTLLIVALMVSSATVTGLFVAMSARSAATAATAEAVTNFHTATALAIDQKSDDLVQYRTDALEARKQLLREVTNAQIGALDKLNAAVEAGDISMADAQERAKQMLNSFRYAQDDYFFAFTPDMTSIVEPNPTFRGQMLNYRDPNGKQFFREFQSVALGPGSGFVDYVGTRVGLDTPAPKVSYIHFFKPWQWVIGTGVYLDDIDQEVSARLDQAKRDLSAAFAVERIAGTGFFYVLSRDGTVIAAPDDRQSALGNDESRKLASTLLNAAPVGDTSIHQVEAMSSLDGESENWLFQVSSSPRDDWVLVSAVPEERLSVLANTLVARLTLISLVVLIVGVLVGIVLSRRIARPISQVTEAAIALERDQFNPDDLAAAASRRDEVGVLARAFRRMGAEVMVREQALRARVQRLQVVVDQSKVDNDISQITESDFFQRLEQQAEEIRNRD